MNEPIICFQDPPPGSCRCNCGTGEEPRICEHQFDGWHNFEDGSGGSAKCVKCGLLAIDHDIWTMP